MATALCPGSFDPVTNGHLDIIERTARHFAHVVVAVIRNPQKSQSLFTLEERQEMLLEVTSHLDNVRIDFFKGLLVDYAREHGANAIVKGLRAVSDFDYELQMAQMNQRLSGIDTFFISTSPQYSFLSSSLVREVAKFGGDVSSMVPPAVAARLAGRFEADRRLMSNDAPSIDELLLELKDMVENARTMPMSASVLVNREDVLQLVDEILAAFPDELRHARWLLKERDDFLVQARREADDILAAARIQVERMVERTEIVREAHRVAQRTVDDADAQARRMRLECEDYVDQKLAEFEVVLDRTMQAVQQGRQRLQVSYDTLDEEEEEFAEDTQAFFDQDDG